MQKSFSRISDSNVFWIFLILLSIALEAVALYYQYELEYLPCVLCVHIRMLLVLVIIVSCMALIWKRVRTLCFILTSLLWLWLLERSWKTLATEMRWSIDECSMSSGLPSWLALEKWFPVIFEIHEPCGYTPFLIYNITMAQSLVVLSFTLSILCLFSLTCSGLLKADTLLRN